MGKNMNKGGQVPMMPGLGLLKPATWGRALLSKQELTSPHPICWEVELHLRSS